MNGEVNPSQSDGVYPEGLTVSFTCDEGYNLDGSESSTCAQGSWNPEPPVCTEGNLIIDFYCQVIISAITNILFRIFDITLQQ